MIHTVPAFDRLGEENAFAVLARATALSEQGRDIVNLGIGQPDFRTPGHIVEAAIKALRDGHHGYTPATGLLATREAVVRRTLETTGVEISPDNVMILPGGKPTMFAAILMFGEPGADILYPDPGFPIYRSMIEFTGARPVPVPIREENGFAFSADYFRIDLKLTYRMNNKGFMQEFFVDFQNLSNHKRTFSIKGRPVSAKV